MELRSVSIAVSWLLLPPSSSYSVALITTESVSIAIPWLRKSVSIDTAKKAQKTLNRKDSHLNLFI